MADTLAPVDALATLTLVLMLALVALLAIILIDHFIPADRRGGIVDVFWLIVLTLAIVLLLRWT